MKCGGLKREQSVERETRQIISHSLLLVILLSVYSRLRLYSPMIYSDIHFCSYVLWTQSAGGTGSVLTTIYRLGLAAEPGGCAAEARRIMPPPKKVVQTCCHFAPGSLALIV